jgi:hypothetical protein
MNPYQPSNLGESIVALIFYLIMAAFVIYSLIAIYSLLKYGRSKMLGLTVVILYLIISLSLYLAALGNLEKIKF